jgi:hypothetical protein
MIESALAIADKWRVASVVASTPEDVRDRGVSIERERIDLLADRASARMLRNQRREARDEASLAVATARALLAWDLTPSEREPASVALYRSLQTWLQILTNQHDPAAREVADEMIRLGEADVAAHPDAEVSRRRLALALYMASSAAFTAGDRDAAHRYSARGLPIQEALARTSGAISDRTTLFGFLQAESRFAPEAEREPLLRRALAVAEEAHRVDLQNVGVAVMYIDAATDLAATLTERLQLREALDALDRPRALVDELSKRAAGDIRYQRTAARYEAARGRALFPLERRDEAVVALRRCIEVLAPFATDAASPDAFATGCTAQLAFVLGPRNKEAQALAAGVRAVLASPKLAEDRQWIEAALAAFPR